MRILYLLAASLLLQSCFNVVGNKVQSPDTASNETASKTGVAFRLTSVVPSANPATGGTPTATATTAVAPPIMTLIFNPTSGASLSDFCQQGSSPTAAKACKCRFQWPQRSSGGASFIRTNETDLTQVTSAQVQCLAPSVFDSEIPEGTEILISLVPNVAAGNVSGFTTNQVKLTKTINFSDVDFRDREGRGFKDVYHYVCHDKVKKNLLITHAKGKPLQPNQDFPPIEAQIANRFEVGNATPDSSSAQSYYYDFYVRSNEVGSINASNGSLTCPRVNVPSGSASQFFPLDSTFSLALNSSKDFNIQVTSNIVIATQAGNSPGSILGFAAKANTDGTCPVFADFQNRPKPTYRLRQYRAVYPLRFDSAGRVLDATQPANTIYVLDRPVSKTGIDASKPITRLGPKPCPWAFKSAQFNYQCMSSATLEGWSIDGTQIAGDASCPVYPPPPSRYVKPDGTFVIRPYKSFLPHFLENTNFKACAYPSSTPVDPEIVLSYDNQLNDTNAGPHNFYCAQHYPNASDIVPKITDPSDRSPSNCALSDSAEAIKGDQSFSCLRSNNPTNTTLKDPAAGCCQICSGSDCSAATGGITAAGRNAVFSPPQDAPGANPAQASKLLPRAIPNKAGQGGCFDPVED